jgi:hypothetical protein
MTKRTLVRSYVNRAIVGSLVLAACGGNEAPPPIAPSPPPPAIVTAPVPVASTPAPEAPPPPLAAKAIPRAEFNRLALAYALPVFWTEDKNNDGGLDPDELAVFWGLVPGAKRADYVKDGAFTNKFLALHATLAQGYLAKPASKPEPGKPDAVSAPHQTMPAEEHMRLLALEHELAQGRPTLIRTDMSKLSPEEQTFAQHIVRAAEIIERLYNRQMGNDTVARYQDPVTRAVYFRNQAPKCVAPLTQAEPHCKLSPQPLPNKLSGLYAAPIMAQAGFCEMLAKQGDKSLMDPFTVVEGTPDKPKAVPYTNAFKADMEAVSNELRQAASDLKDPKESSLRAYLLAAAQAFLDNQWVPADEAWAKMGVDNSKFYLRIAPDEVYSEPCSTKALFHVSFGLINQGSRKWQQKLDPLKTAMEDAIAGAAGAPYKARKVSFKLPDFVDVALNAGDSRSPFGATIGQSLPNFGPVANEGRGRTVAMTNFYLDKDSMAATQTTAESLFCAATMANFTLDPEPQLMSTVLHEAAHNLGPAHQYKVGEKIDREVFGGPLASTLEELKAQTAAMFYAEWLVQHRELDRAFADKAHVRDVFWGFGHISRGMYDEDHHPRNYSQLAAIQFGHFIKAGALRFEEKEKAANGKDVGCYNVDLKKMPAAIKSLMTISAGIKGRGDKAAAEQLIKQYVDALGERRAHLGRIQQRVLRAPKPTFLYSLD